MARAAVSFEKHYGPHHMPSNERRSSIGQQRLLDTYQHQLLEKIASLNTLAEKLDKKIEDSLDVGRQNGDGIRLLRAELGLGGEHGRLPQIEKRLTQIERLVDARVEKTDARIEKLEDADLKLRGRRELVAALLSLAGGSLGAAMIGWIAHALGWIH